MHRVLALVLGLALLLAAAAALAACGGDEKGAPPLPAAPDRIEVTSAEMSPGGPIPDLYTCDGLDLSPPLAWEKVPEKTKALALVVEDPDASGGPFVHWTAYDIPRRIGSLAEGQAPFRAKQGENGFGKEVYGGPCPPEDDEPHDYEFAVYALRDRTGLQQGAKAEEVLAAIERLATARGVLTARYGR